MVVIIPEEDLYEQGVFPSRRNTDHKWTFTIYKKSTWSRRSINVAWMIAEVGEIAQCVKMELLDATFRYGLGPSDQTLTPIGECAIEFILRKRTAGESEAGGRLPAGSP